VAANPILSDKNSMSTGITVAVIPGKETIKNYMNKNKDSTTNFIKQ